MYSNTIQVVPRQRYRGTMGLSAVATFYKTQPPEYAPVLDNDPDFALAFQKILQGEATEFLVESAPGGYFQGKPLGAIYTVNGKKYVVSAATSQGGSIAYQNTPLMSTTPSGPNYAKSVSVKPPGSLVSEVYYYAQLRGSIGGPSSVVDTGTNPGNTNITTQRPAQPECPPKDNCTEKWVEKVLYVSAQPSANAIQIPVAFEKMICEGESEEDPQIDCDELLTALQASVDEGGVPGMINGLAALPDFAAPGNIGQPSGPSNPSGVPTTPWCQNCTTKLVKAFAYVTDSPAPSSKPFKVKIKVLVCETDANPKIDCAEVIAALKTGMKDKGMKALSGLRGLSNATTLNPASSAGQAAAAAGVDFQVESQIVDGQGSASVQEAGWPWWVYVILLGVGVYAVKNVIK